MIRLLYFASLRETLDLDGEDFPLAAPLTVAALRAELANRGAPWTAALAAGQPLLAAINQELVAASTLIRDGDEVAFFPPVTGG